MQTTPVEEIRLYGLNFLRFSDNPLRVKDPQTIAKLQQALTKAETRVQQVANRVDVMEIHYQPIKGKRPMHDLVHINTTSMPDCFGPEFFHIVNQLEAKPPSP
jgi:hypothetical protein